jgi:hypothetical protein
MDELLEVLGIDPVSFFPQDLREQLHERGVRIDQRLPRIEEDRPDVVHRLDRALS